MKEPFQIQKGCYYLTRKGRQVVGPMKRWMPKKYPGYVISWTTDFSNYHFGNDGRVNTKTKFPVDLVQRVHLVKVPSAPKKK